MSTERVRILMPYTADVVPRGARNVRPVIARMEAVVDFRTVASVEVEPAVVVMRRGKATTWYGHGGRLYRPIEDRGGELSAADLIAALSAGAQTVAGKTNPFMAVGSSPSFPSVFAQAQLLEEMALRRVVTEDSEEKLACAARLAEDFLFVDGRALRRSPGPFWRCSASSMAMVSSSIYLVDMEHDLPTPEAVYFNVLRRGEAEEFLAAEGDGKVPAERWGGTVDILRPDCVEDLDAMVAAQAVANCEALHWIAMIVRHRPAFGDAMTPVMEGAGRLYGRRPELLTRGLTGYQCCPGIPVVSGDDILTAVEGVRSFFAGVEVGRGDVRRAYDSYREIFDSKHSRHVRRFDVHEYDRLQVSLPAPDLAPGPMP